MHDTARNLSTIQSIYAAFGRGDAPAILEHLREDVDWEFGAPDHGVPWQKHGRGREAALAFLQTLGGELEFKRFELLSIMADGPWVVALTQIECVVRKNGATFVEVCEPHVWRCDEHGRVAAMRHAADSYTQWRAWSASAA